MKTFSKGIVLRSIDYGDTSAIVKIFTHNHGLRSFLIRGVKGKRKKTAYLQPLSLIEIEYHLHERKDLLVAGNIRFLDSYHSIYTHPHKRMVGIFLSEVLSETIKSDHSDEPLFDYIHSRLLLFDLEEWNPNFHLFFMASMTRFLGFYPLLEPEPLCFDADNGAFLRHKANGLRMVHNSEAKVLYRVFTESWDEIRNITIAREVRNKLTAVMVDYYQTHATNMKPLKSLKVLTEMMSE